MSRIIIKNLPKQIKEKKLVKIFTQEDKTITDVQLKYSKDGTFRQFAFIGFAKPENASEAVKYFNNTFIDTSRIKVELCSEFGDVESKPKAWSKHTQKTKSDNESGFYKKQDEKLSESKKKSSIIDDGLASLKNDPEFKEFMEIHHNVNDQRIWDNDERIEVESDSEEVEKSSSDDIENEKIAAESPSTVKNSISDLDYLRSKMVKANNVQSKDAPTEATQKDMSGFTVKLRNLPYRCKKKDIKAFFGKFKPKSLRIPPKVKGIAYAMFVTKKGYEAALAKHRSILDGHRVDVVKYHNNMSKEAVVVANVEKKPWKKTSTEDPDNNQELETIAESGRLFVRNLSYTCTESDLEELFKKYGLLSEVNLPIDKFTRKIKGFGFITYLMPENAVKACAELDGHSFQGRILHILPSKMKKSMDNEDENEGSFKKKKAKEIKSSSSSPHNWNALFLGANAIADVMSDKYDTSKSNILDSEGRGSVAVRVALGETQIVNETRDFLIKNGVNLDEFSQPASERSKVVIIVKNLPSGTTTMELKSLFGKHGVVKSVLFPPSGITAIVEMEESSEARSAFRTLAYSKFHHLPLYLEWAPMKVFREDREVIEQQQKEIEVEKLEEAEEDTEEISEANIFVKSLNFKTTEKTLLEHFKVVGKVHSVTIMRKRKANDGNQLSMGYGFVNFHKKEDAVKAIKELQNTVIDGHSVELKLSQRATQQIDKHSIRKTTKIKESKSTKILVRNVPFEAKKQELEDLFKVFGDLKFVRLPKKITGQHRGFAFVEFTSKNDSTRAFKSLCHSTHLYGRRLVLEWAEAEDDAEIIRKKTAKQFLEGGPKMKKFKKSIVTEKDFVNSAQDGNDAGVDDV